MKIAATIAFLSLLTSCAQYSLHKGGYAQQVESNETETNGKRKVKGETDIGLRISSQIDDKLSSNFFGMINLTFENTTSRWIRIEKVYFKFDHPEVNESVKFVSGNQLNYFLDAVNDMNKEKAKVAAQNQATLAAVAAGVAAAGTSSRYNNYSGVNFLAGATLGAAMSMNISQFEAGNREENNKKLFPDGHLYHKDFVIPPGLFTKKWILLNTSNHDKIGRLKEALLTYVTSDGKKETVILNLKGNSNWQRDTGYIKQLKMNSVSVSENVLDNRR